MKKSVITLSILSWIFVLAGVFMFLFMGTALGGYYDGLAFVQTSFWPAVQSMFDFSSVTITNIVFFVVLGIVVILFLIQLVLLIVNKHPKAIPVMISFLVIGAVAAATLMVVMKEGIIPDATGTVDVEGEGGAVTPTDYSVPYTNAFAFIIGLFQVKAISVIQMIGAFAIIGLIFLGFILMLIGEIVDLVLIVRQPGLPARDYAKDLETSDKVVVVKEDSAPLAPSSDEIRAILRDELNGRPAASASASAPRSEPADDEYHPSAESEYRGHASFGPLPPPNGSPAITGPLLIQYINTYAPEGGRQQIQTEEPHKKEEKPAVPASEVQATIEGRAKPLTADDVRKIIKEELEADKKPAPAAQPLIVALPAAAEKAPEEKPLSKEDVQKIIAEEKPQPAPLSLDDIRKIVSEELASLKEKEEPAPEEKKEESQQPTEVFDDGEEEDEANDEIVVEPAPEEPLTADDIREIIAEELSSAQRQSEEKQQEEEAALLKSQREEEEKAQAALEAEQAAAAKAPEENIRDVIKEELAAYKKAEQEEKEKAAQEEAARQAEEEKKAQEEAKRQEEAARQKALEEQKAKEEVEKRQAEEAERQAQEKKRQDEEAARREEDRKNALTPDQVRQIIADELAKQKPAEPAAKPLSAEDIRSVIAEELANHYKKAEPAPQPVAKKEPAPAPAAAPAPIVVVEAPLPSPTPEPVKEEKPAPSEPTKRVVGAFNPDLPPHPKIIRIPFPTRMLSSDKELQNNYNDLKSELLSYGVKSRLSNSGDTFRLHKVTFVKVTIAGKSLKLYFALDPKDYANTTLPIQNAGHKGIYKEIPLVFKVKSELSLRRAKQLIADVMDKGGLEQGKIEPNNWAATLKDYKAQGADDDDGGDDDE